MVALLPHLSLLSSPGSFLFPTTFVERASRLLNHAKLDMGSSMLLLLLSAAIGLAASESNVTLWGAPRFSLGDTLPNTDSHGHVFSVAANVADAPSCGNTSGTADGRSIAYYQAWNIHTRPCDKVWPSQVNTAGLTHLTLAFASIDPKTYRMRFQRSADDDIYRQFVALKRDGLETWLGVGGWEFSDEGETRTTWSDMASTKENRKAFIDSTLGFLDKYEFQGLDVDWEWPAASNRGGRPEDTQNQVPQSLRSSRPRLTIIGRTDEGTACSVGKQVPAHVCAAPR